jgi:hypothetical protein
VLHSIESCFVGRRRLSFNAHNHPSSRCRANVPSLVRRGV